MFKLLLWILIIYFVSRFIRRIINAFLLQNNARNNQGGHDVNGPGVYHDTKTRNHYNINEKDIVEAKFEEIKPEEEEKEKKDPDKE